jgi:phosphoserine phosphatase RsbU/P
VANRSAAATFGYPAEQLLTMNVDALVATDARPKHHQLVADFFRVAVPRVMGVGREEIAVDATGREFPVEIGLSPVDTPTGPCVVAAIVDITERKRRDKESTLARLVQEAMLPKVPDDLPGLEIAARSEPADATGGDFYDMIRFPDGRFGIVIGDASGHGFSAALVTATARSYLRALMRTETDLGVIMRTTNSLLIDDVLDNRFVTLLFAILDPRQMTLSYAGAGHIGYLLNRNGDVKCHLDQNGPPLGWFQESDYPVTTLSVEHGDVLVLLTDGIEESMNPGGSLFSRQRILDLLRKTIDQPASTIVHELHQAVHDFHETTEAHDDATAIIARIL